MTDEDITSWVTSALRLKLRELILMAFLYDSESLFRRLCGCVTLVRIEICGSFVLRVPKGISFCLPNVKELSLANLIFNDEDEKGDGSINRLFYGCQALESLCIRSCEFENTQSLFIMSNLLKKLTIQDSWNDTRCELWIHAPNLKILFYSDFAAEDNYICTFPCLLEGHIDVRPNIDDCNDEEYMNYIHSPAVQSVFTACISAVRLYVSAPSIEALMDIEFPRLENLTSLSLGCIGLHEWEVLACFLQNAPNLEKLTLQEGFSEPSRGFAKFKTRLPKRPSRLELKLKEIDYWAFKDEEDEIKLLQYFL